MFIHIKTVSGFTLSGEERKFTVLMSHITVGVALNLQLLHPISRLLWVQGLVQLAFF